MSARLLALTLALALPALPILGPAVPAAFAGEAEAATTGSEEPAPPAASADEPGEGRPVAQAGQTPSGGERVAALSDETPSGGERPSAPSDETGTAGKLTPEQRESVGRMMALFIITLILLLVAVAGMVIASILLRRRVRRLEERTSKARTELEDLWWKMRPSDDEPFPEDEAGGPDDRKTGGDGRGGAGPTG